MTRKIIKILMFVFLISLVIILTSCGNEQTATTNGESNESTSQEGTSQGEETIKLKVADSLPTTNILSKEGAVFWMERVKELTNNKVTFEYYPAESLGKASSMYDLIASKVTDIGYTAYAKEHLPLSDVVSLPRAITSAADGTKAYWELVDSYLLEKEYLKNGIRPLFGTTQAPFQLITKNNKIEKLDDFKGFKLRTAGGAVDLTIRALGATPVAITPPEMYEAMDRGTVDGVIIPIPSLEPYQIDQIAKYVTTNANLGTITAIWSINEEVYQKLPEDVKQAIEQAGKETNQHLAEVLDKEVLHYLERYKAEGKMEIYDLSEEELVNWKKTFEKVWDEWANNLESRGLPGKEVIQKYRDIIGN